MTWTRTLIVWILLAVSPLTGVRLVCVSEPQTTNQALQPDALACQTFCAKHPPAAYRTRCALFEDPTCAFALGSAIAVLPDRPALTLVVRSEPFDVVYHTGSAYPAPDRASPPPKA